MTDPLAGRAATERQDVRDLGLPDGAASPTQTFEKSPFVLKG